MKVKLMLLIGILMKEEIKMPVSKEVIYQKKNKQKSSKRVYCWISRMKSIVSKEHKQWSKEKR